VHDDVFACRWCGSTACTTVLDLGAQPPSDVFPRAGAGEPVASYPLSMVVCGRCGLAQLAHDPTEADEPRGLEPRALVEQAHAAVDAVARAGLLAAAPRVAEYDSPHGGSWRSLLVGRGCVDVTGQAGYADVVVDVFGLMHEADQRAAVRARTERLAPGGVLLVQYHPLTTIVEQGQWNALRHGHMAYYSTRALTGMLAGHGLVAESAWTFPLYGGTVLLAARRGGTAGPSVRELLAADDARGVLGPELAAGLQGIASAAAARLRGWLCDQRRGGRRVLGYGAASRAVPLLVAAGIMPDLLRAVADGSAAKWGRLIPGVDIPIISPAELCAARPDAVLLFVPDLLDEVRRALPEVEAGGGRWVLAEAEPRPVPPQAH